MSSSEMSKVMDTVQEKQGRPFRAWSVACDTNAFSYLTEEGKYRNISSTLAALCKKGQLERVSRGVYKQVLAPPANEDAE